MSHRIPLLVVASLAAGCAVTDGHVRPDLDAPQAFRGAPPSATDEASFGETPWREVFTDPALQALLARAFDANHDVRNAAARVEESRARLGLAEAARGPRIDAAASAGASELSRSVLPTGDRTTRVARAGLLASWEIDFWGRLGRLSDAARADLLAAEDARDAVETSLVAEVASAWYELCDLDAELAISRATLRTREESLQLTRARQTRGVGDLLDVQRAQSLVDGAAQQIPLLEEQVTKTEDALRFLVGGDPGPIERGATLVDQTVPTEVALGRPAELLDRRPDVRAAEAALSAQEARVDAAKALFYPRLSLTGGVGFLTGGGTPFFDDTSRFADSAISAVFPVFTSGELASNLEAERARRLQALVSYDRAIRAAYRDVADAVAERRKTDERAVALRRFRDALAETSRLAHMRFDGGVDSYLSVLDAERSLFEAELALAQVERDRRVAVVRLYRALGGGLRASR